MDVLTEYSSPIVLAKVIEKAAEEASDPYFVSMARRAKVVQDRFERGQTDAARALEALFREIELAHRREKRAHTESMKDHAEAGRGREGTHRVCHMGEGWPKRHYENNGH